MIKNNRLFLTSILLKTIYVLLIFSSLFIPFAPAITLKSNTIQKTFGTAFAFMFGGTITTANITYESKQVSILLLISYIIILVSLITLIISFILNKKNKKISNIMVLISILLILISSILVLCSHQSVANILADSLINSHSETVSKTIYENTNLEFGIYGISIFGFLSIIIILVSFYIDNYFKKI